MSDMGKTQDAWSAGARPGPCLLRHQAPTPCLSTCLRRHDSAFAFGTMIRGHARHCNRKMNSHKNSENLPAELCQNVLQIEMIDAE
jgi:hypothetical protein